MGRRGRADDIRRFLIASASLTPRGLAMLASHQFGISRQAAHKHLSDLVDEGLLQPSGETRGREYRLAIIDRMNHKLKIEKTLEEHRVWEEVIQPRMQGVPENITSICLYGFTEIFNNVVDHSEGDQVNIRFTRTAASVELWITDNGVGIFNKIQRAFNLPDPRLSILELAKGKLTTDPANHTGEGIFFSSRMFERFAIISGSLLFDHTQPDDDWLIEHRGSEQKGTIVAMVSTTWTSLTPKDVFDKYSDKEDYSFSKTHVPVSLAQFGNDQLVSRSQAKRVLARVDRFSEVMLDFQNVPTIGQAFADEIFRVFVLAHPNIKITPFNTNSQVKRMIMRAKSNIPEIEPAEHESRSPTKLPPLSDEKPGTQTE